MHAPPRRLAFLHLHELLLLERIPPAATDQILPIRGGSITDLLGDTPSHRCDFVELQDRTLGAPTM
jgi:hypothetical protein